MLDAKRENLKIQTVGVRGVIGDARRRQGEGKGGPDWEEQGGQGLSVD